ncbi:MAG: HAMP domain-containing histidine kinase [Myxococcales bacterium]|nr:HAMP domain-containing histidine kinase [Myxococcales bacterium]
MRQLLLRVFTPLLPAEPRRVAELARELGDARREGRTPRIDASRGPLEKAVVRRLEGAAAAAERAERARVAAAAAEEYQREFLLAMSHEIRTPLNAIQGFSRVLLDEIDGPITSEERVDLEAIHEAGSHLFELLQDFLALVSEGSNRNSFQEAPYSGRDLLAEVGRLARGLSRRASVRFVVEAPAEDVVFYGDRGKIRQVLVNLVSNALKFTMQGEVVLSLEEKGVRGVFVVRDTGPGMAAAPREAGEFVQTREESKRGRGSGLGLAIVERIVRLSQGELRIESRPGSGTRIEVELPTLEGRSP